MDAVEKFIERRFPNNYNWMNGNCYYFARILQLRFKGKIYYDVIDGHFLFYDGVDFYDWTGRRDDYNVHYGNLVNWDEYQSIDSAHYNRIYRDCIE